MIPMMTLSQVIGPRALPEAQCQPLTRIELQVLLRLRSLAARRELGHVLDSLPCVRDNRWLHRWRVRDVLIALQQQAPGLLPPNLRRYPLPPYPAAYRWCEQ